MFGWDGPSEVTGICSWIKEHQAGSSVSSSGKISCRRTPEWTLPNLGELSNECKINRMNLACSLSRKPEITAEQTRQKKNKLSFSSPALQVPLLLCHASRFVCGRFSERQTGTYHSMRGAPRTCQLGGGSGVYSNQRMATNGDHRVLIETHPACDHRAEQLEVERDVACVARAEAQGRRGMLNQ